MIVHVDGGARGNPGPGAAACAIVTESGELVKSAVEALGVTTNNAAEYRAILLGLRCARACGAKEVVLNTDSELIAMQVNGEYKLRDPRLRPLHRQVRAALKELHSWSLVCVPRFDNRGTDAMVSGHLSAMLEQHRPPA